MKNNKTDFAEHIGAKICHEVAGLLSAIDTGLNLLHGTNPSISKKAYNLCVLSVNQVVGKLKFLRLMYGTVDIQDTITLHFIKQLCDSYSQDTEIIFQDLTEKDLTTLCLPSNVAKLTLCFIVAACGGLIHGGYIEVNFNEFGEHNQIKVNAVGDDLHINQEQYDTMRGKISPVLSVFNVHAHYTKYLIEDIHETIIDIGSSKVEHVIKYKR